MVRLSFDAHNQTQRSYHCQSYLPTIKPLPPLPNCASVSVTSKIPRVERTKEHQLLDIFTIAICAVICGADGYEDMAEFGKAKRGFFERFLELPNGIPLA